ncbi:hypothetical protein ACCO45_011513 [Purpureocillium lilacinum]|uniref:Uncharacterized protein n=1 Tax=Purpureocillium lilacinum TaxID=33203 RepID=A0ACC4DB42_PURLI
MDFPGGRTGPRGRASPPPPAPWHLQFRTSVCHFPSGPKQPGRGCGTQRPELVGTVPLKGPMGGAHGSEHPVARGRGQRMGRAAREASRRHGGSDVSSSGCSCFSCGSCLPLLPATPARAALTSERLASKSVAARSCLKYLAAPEPGKAAFTTAVSFLHSLFQLELVFSQGRQNKKSIPRPASLLASVGSRSVAWPNRCIRTRPRRHSADSTCVVTSPGLRLPTYPGRRPPTTRRIWRRHGTSWRRGPVVASLGTPTFGGPLPTSLCFCYTPAHKVSLPPAL